MPNGRVGDSVTVLEDKLQEAMRSVCWYSEWATSSYTNLLFAIKRG